MSNIERTTSKADSIGVDHKETILAVEAAEESNTTVWKLLRENVRVIIFTWFANCGAFLFGYDVLVQGAINALPMFSITFGSPFGETFILPALWQGLWQAFSAMGIMAGSASNGFLQDRFGRKIMFGVRGLISAVGTAITFVSGNPETVEQRRGVLLVGKFFIGLAMGISMSTCQTYVSEISPPKLRTILLGFYPFMITVGQMIAITVVFKEVATMTHWAFKIPFASQWAFSGYSVIAALVVPESPVYLASKHKIDQARKALTTLGCENIDERIAIIEATIQQEQRMNTEQPSFSECFKGTNLRRTRIVALLNTLQQFMGITLVSNSTYFFIMAGMTPTFSLTLNQIGVGLSMACTLVSRFTFHGFRYAQIDNWPGSQDDILEKVEAVVCHTDMEETGYFSCSDDMLNKLWSNFRWSTKGNFLSIPTDCPQRDERLGWTGDIALFAPTVTFLYGCHGILNDWLKGLYYEQKKRNGIPPMVSPNTIVDGLFAQVHPFAIWHDVTVLAPWALWEEHGDCEILAQQYDSMMAWLNAVPMGKEADKDHLWDSTVFQLADWLDPSAPPDAPQKSATDMMLVANTFLIHSYNIMVRIVEILGNDDSSVYKAKAATAREQYAKQYISETGRMTSDSQTAYALAICFNLLAEPCQLKLVGDRLTEIVRANEYRVGTGFAGTPFICEALAKTNHMDVAYGMLLNKKCPSWLYPVAMGATTIWERWDSMLPDGSINPGDMTSFNHYAYGAVAKFMVERVAGLKQLEPAWTRCRVDPCVGGGITSARASHSTPHGNVSVSWKVIEGGGVQLDVVVPPFTEMEVVLGNGDSDVQVVGHGEWSFKRHV